MNKRDKNNRLTKEQALIAVNAQNQPIPIKPPSPKELQDFYSNKLSPEAKERIFAYLNSHPEAYEAWLQTSKKKSGITTKIVSLYAKLSSFLYLDKAAKNQNDNKTNLFLNTNLQYRVAFSIVGLCTILIIFQLFSSPDSRTLVKQSYTELANQISQESINELTWPWQQLSQTYGFSPDKEISPASNAYAIGLITGKQTLLSTDRTNPTLEKLNGQESSTQKYTDLGRWNMLLWTVANSRQEMPISFWKTQLKIASSLNKQFKNLDQDYEFINSHIQSVTVLIKKLNEKHNARLYKKLDEELLISRTRLAPVVAPSE